ncbi:MAG: DNRLRE domain-containing protein [Planctomycetota bacterium]|nr:DNRLRE domain-containing protein [Planctomycetota bacterium]
MRFKIKEIAVAVIGVSLSTFGISLARAGQVNISASEDACLLGGTSAAKNQSMALPGMFVGTDGPGNPKRGLIKFDIAGAVPAGATITGAQLQLTVGLFAGNGGFGPGGVSGAETISLFDETRTWGQPANIVGATSFGGNGNGAPAQNGDATWNNAFYNSNSALAMPWTVPGGNWTAASADIADASVTGTLTSFTWSSAPMIADVQNWLNNPTADFGWLIKSADEVTVEDFRAFWSSQGAAANNNPAIAPVLSVTYTVPEPMSISLLFFGAPVLLCRRQRLALPCA